MVRDRIDGTLRSIVGARKELNDRLSDATGDSELRDAIAKVRIKIDEALGRTKTNQAAFRPCSRKDVADKF